ncbi:hypothetical protein AVEN_230965-1 [Araneus ventricosus]|uniref:Uncharacterized protein n=1 Tax=Araneus ventricosus TaxID=182803 RepID=A0A4Y2A3E1_ARAVE|nr:hypothetical protein AVEN_230965-1 [Araneus ventricosus]
MSKETGIVQRLFLEHPKHALWDCDPVAYRHTVLEQSTIVTLEGSAWTSESDNLNFVPLCGHGTRSKDNKRCADIQHDSSEHKDSTSTKVIHLPYIGGMVAGTMFYPDEDSSRITLCTDSRLISGPNLAVQE